MCPYTVIFSQYGNSCAPTTNMGPILSATADGSSSCAVAIDFNVQQPCGHCGQYVSGQWLVVGLNQMSMPSIGGCSLYVTPDFLIPLPPAIGSTLVEGDMPSDPALIGMSFYMQGIITRVSTLGATTDVEFSNGLEMNIAP
jgi:hypothetical protein